MEEFLAKVSAILEVPAVSPETDFRTVEGWCSLKAFGLLVMLEQDYGKTLSIERFMSIRSVGELASAAGMGSDL